MNINHYALRKEREIQKFINKLPPLNAAAAGVGNDKRITHHSLTGYHNNHLPISVFVPKHKESGEKFPIIIDIYGGGFVAGRSEQNKCFGAWCAEHGYLTFIPEYTPIPETNLFGQIGDILKAFEAIDRLADNYDGDKSKMYLVGDGAGAALACLTYALIWHPVSMRLQNGIFTLTDRKTAAITPYLMEKDWKKTSYAPYVSPKTYAKMLPPCFLVTSISDSQKKDTKRFSNLLVHKRIKCKVYITHTPFTKESFAARYPNKPYSETANLEMLKFFEQI